MIDAPTSNTDGFKVPLLPHYVYVLLNPRDGNKPFYVGKGTGQRAGAHERDVVRLLENERQKRRQQEEQDKQEQNSNDEDFKDSRAFGDKSLSDKEIAIIGLISAEARPLQVIVGRYETAEEAYAVEAVLIHFMFDYEKLTNIASGHGYKFLRTKIEYEKIVATAKVQDDIPLRKGIDEERFVRDNQYRDESLMGLEQSNAFDTLAELQDSLTSNGFNWRNFTEPGDKYFHPGVSNGYLALIVRLGTVDFNIQFTKMKKFSIQFIYTPSRPRSIVEAHNRALERLPQGLRDRLNISLSEPKAGNKYSWIVPEDRFKFQSIEALIVGLQELKAAIEPGLSNP